MKELLELARQLKEDFDIDFHEFIEECNEEDFEINDYRFIHEDEIDQIMQDELSSDEYVLGCFNASFLAGILDMDQDVIEAMQKAEAFEAIGKLVISMDKLEELQQEYVSADSYGHHFAHYDGHEHTCGSYYVFKIN